jgi:hypothetical protein
VVLTAKAHWRKTSNVRYSKNLRWRYELYPLTTRDNRAYRKDVKIKGNFKTAGQAIQFHILGEITENGASRKSVYAVTAIICTNSFSQVLFSRVLIKQRTCQNARLKIKQYQQTVQGAW